MKITQEQAKYAYKISKSVYKGDFSFTEGKKKLKEQGISEGSSAIYINDFSHMIKGEVFKKTLNAFSLKFFLQNILNDFGPKAFSTALNSLKLHIEYYEGIQRGTNPKMKYGRAIYNKFIRDLPTDLQDEHEQNELLKLIKPKKEIINYLNNLKETDPEIVAINGKSYKRDNKTIVEIKKLRDFKCQICSTTIKKKDGTCYIEAAHIKPKILKGRETPDNILILCPNHHKEFDYGQREVIALDKEQIEFLLNGQNYIISLRIV